MLEYTIPLGTDGDITTGTSRPGRYPLTVDRKVEFLVCELKRFQMNVVGSVKLNGLDNWCTYLLDGCAVVHSG